MKGYYGKKVQILKVAHSTTECHEIVWYFDTSYKAGERGDQGGGGQNTWGPEHSERPGNPGECSPSFIIALCLS